MRLLVGLLAAAAASADVSDAVKTLVQATAGLPPALSQAYRLGGALSLRDRYPELSRRLVDLTVAEARASGVLEIVPMRKLAELAPDEAVALLPSLKADARGPMLNELVYARHTTAALQVFRDMLARDDLAIFQANPLLSQLLKDRPGEAVDLFRRIVAAFPFDRFAPEQAWAFMNCARTMKAVAPGLGAETAERLAKIAAPPAYGADAPRTVQYTFEIGSKSVTISDPREMILLMSGALLHELAPERFRQLQSHFARWSFDTPLIVESTKRIGAGASAPASNPAAEALRKRMQELRGDLGAAALAAAAETLAQSLRETPGQEDAYLQLARLVRYEGVKVSDPGPALAAADALLGLREEVHRRTGFTVTGLDGKSFSLEALRGKVVLLNFWATWCEPCRQEMPDLAKLHRAFGDRGLVIVAVTDEEADVARQFVAKERYSFRIALDPGRKAHTAFDIEGIPRSFLFDREGRLVGISNGMRSERQFREMLKRAGLD